MRVVIALEQHFSRTSEGNFYPNSSSDYAFWSRYLKVFDEVLVFARVREVEEPEPHTVPLKANGPGVSFIPLPDYSGPVQYFKHRNRLKHIACSVVNDEDAYILRVPGIMGALLWKELTKIGHPYGVEVVGDPWDSLAPGSVKSLLRPVFRRTIKNQLARQCRMAAAASYVTKYSLQKRYPPGGWSISYSDVALPKEVLINTEQVKKKIAGIKQKSESKDPWRICYAGTMAQLYKAPDILIEAFAECLRAGLNAELVMFGDGQYRRQLQRQAASLGVDNHVHFGGWLSSGQAVYEQFDKADLYVLPSRQEGLPRSVIEAMARGLPCITSNVGGLGELMEQQWMVRPNNVSALAGTIKQMLTNTDLMEKAVRRNVKLAAEYELKIMQGNWFQFYDKVREITSDWLGKTT